MLIIKILLVTFVLLHQSSFGLDEVFNKYELDNLLTEQDFVLILWGAKTCRFCWKVEDALESIREPLNDHGVTFIKVFNRKMGKKFEVTNFPDLILYRGGKPLKIPENPLNAEGVLNFLLSGSHHNDTENESSDEDSSENEVDEILSLPDQIETVDTQSLHEMIQEDPFVAVLFLQGDYVSLLRRTNLTHLWQDRGEPHSISVHWWGGAGGPPPYRGNFRKNFCLPPSLRQTVY